MAAKTARLTVLAPADAGLGEADQDGRDGEGGELPAGYVPERHRVHAETDAMLAYPVA
jgi:hypothetical protein